MTSFPRLLCEKKQCKGNYLPLFHHSFKGHIQTPFGNPWTFSPCPKQAHMYWMRRHCLQTITGSGGTGERIKKSFKLRAAPSRVVGSIAEKAWEFRMTHTHRQAHTCITHARACSRTYTTMTPPLSVLPLFLLSSSNPPIHLQVHLFTFCLPFLYPSVNWPIYPVISQSV